MDRAVDLPKCVRVRVAHRQREIARWRAVMLAVNDVPDASNGHAKHEWRGAHIEEPWNAKTAPFAVDGTDEWTEDNRAKNCQAALVNSQNGHWVLSVISPLVNDMKNARSENATDDRPESDRQDVVLVKAALGTESHRQEYASEYAHRSE